MERREEAYEFLETLAPALYAHGIKIHLDTLQNIVHDRGVNAIPQKSPCQPNLLECSRLGTRFQVPILYALTLLARVSQVETLCPHRVSFALLRLMACRAARVRSQAAG